MNEKISFTIDEDLLDAVGMLTPVEKSIISPLKTRGSQVLTPARIARLRSAGIVDNSGKIDEKYRYAVETLASGRSFARLRFTAGLNIFEYFVYFPKDNSKSVSFTHKNNQIVVYYPSATDVAITLINENIGNSALSSCSFNGVFSENEALALFAMIDLARSDLLGGLKDETEPVNSAFEASAILNKIINRKENIQSFEFVLQSRLNTAFKPTLKQVQDGLKVLVEKGFIQKQGKKYQLGEALYHVAGRFPIIDNFIVMEAGTLDPDGNLCAASYIALQAGVNDLLYLECHGEDIILKCITAVELIEHMISMLTDPKIIRISPAVSSTTINCPKCGNVIPSNKKFCPKCGVKIQ